MTEKHINFDLSKTDNVAADVDCLNERNILCKFCNQIILFEQTAVKKSHLVSDFISVQLILIILGRYHQK